MVNVDDDFVFPENFNEIKNKKISKNRFKMKVLIGLLENLISMIGVYI